MGLRIKLLLCTILIIFYIATCTSESWVAQSVSQKIAEMGSSDSQHSSIQIAGGQGSDLFIIQQIEQPPRTPAESTFVTPQSDAGEIQSDYITDIFDLIQDIKRKDEASRLDLYIINLGINDSHPDRLDSLSDDRWHQAHKNSSQEIIIELTKLLADLQYDYGDGPDESSILFLSPMVGDAASFPVFI